MSRKKNDPPFIPFQSPQMTPEVRLTVLRTNFQMLVEVCKTMGQDAAPLDAIERLLEADEEQANVGAGVFVPVDRDPRDVL